MRTNAVRIGGLMVLPVLVCLASAGCGATGGLPTDVTVTLPDGTTETVTMGAGVISLADSEWQFYRVADNAQGAAFMTIRFGDEGQLEAFEESTIASSIFGSSILFDGQRHNTTQAGLQYSAATYGAETADSMGFTFEGILKAYAAGLEAATATATAVAEFDPEDPNIVRGTFSFSSQVLLMADQFPEGNMEDEFSFMGRKVTE